MFDQLKPIMQNGERYVVVEGGKPEYVLMRFRDYAALAGGSAPSRPAPQAAAEWARSRAASEIEFEEVGANDPLVADRAGAPAPDPSTIHLEDLPL